MALYLQNISKSSKNYPGVNSPGNFFSKLMITSMSQFVSTQKKEVINGEWGNGQDRRDRLEAAGYNYTEVQKKVNELLK